MKRFRLPVFLALLAFSVLVWAADFTVNFVTSGTANPYTNASLTFQIGSFRNTNASGLFAVTNGTNNQAVHNVNYGSTLRSDVTIATINSADDPAAAVIVRSGANTGKGYVAYTDGSGGHIATLSGGGGGWVDIAGSGWTQTIANGDIISLTYNKSTGALVALINNIAIGTGATDSTYAAEASLAAGFALQTNNTNGTRIGQFAGTGVQAGNTQQQIMVLGVGH